MDSNFMRYHEVKKAEVEKDLDGHVSSNNTLLMANIISTQQLSVGPVWRFRVKFSVSLDTLHSRLAYASLRRKVAKVHEPVSQDLHPAR
ncbi:hypothetical protein IFM62136_00318 [Aspergillus lentulus]|nr:hypothetical protein IFM62136_00318 [Aspergillus lentulus]